MNRPIFLIFFLVVSHYSYCQGCSDAGFCTMGALKPDQDYRKEIDFKLRSVEINYYNGKSTLSPVISAYTLDLSFGFNQYNSLQIKVPYMSVTGNFGETQGLGDISISASHTFPLENSGSIGVTIGTKIPTGNSTLENTDTEHGVGGDLPMYYQTTLGTYDFIAGTSYITEKWLLATGLQIPVIHNNENDFRWGQWADYPDQVYLRDNPKANHLKRGTDVMLRVERNFRFLNYNFSIGLLPIYRITKDQVFDFVADINNGGDGIYDPNEDELTKLDGTTGLALSALASAGYQFNINNSVKLIYGIKLKQRDLNPDGLTRHRVISASYIYRF